MIQNPFDVQKYAQSQFEKYYSDCHEINKTIAKTKAVEDIRIQGYIARQQLREAEDERKKSTFDELMLTSEGELQFVTRNLSIDAKPRMITNMRSPSLTILKRVNDITQIIYLIGCIANGIQKEIFFDPQKSEKFPYVKRKFASAGICLRISNGQKKEFFFDLVSLLMLSSSSELYLPDKEGYFESDKRGLTYIGKEDLTWRKAVKLCK